QRGDLGRVEADRRRHRDVSGDGGPDRHRVGRDLVEVGVGQAEVRVGAQVDGGAAGAGRQGDEAAGGGGDVDGGAEIDVVANDHREAARRGQRAGRTGDDVAGAGAVVIRNDL